MKRRKEPRTRRIDPVLAGEVEALARLGGGRHVPVRTCAGCARRAPQATLDRFALAPAGGLEWRRGGGRGAYLHREPACQARFVSGKPLIAALKTRVDRRARQALVDARPSTLEA